MAVYEYRLKSGERFFLVRTWLKLPDGRLRQFVKRGIPTREQAKKLESLKKVEAFEGRYLSQGEQRRGRAKVSELWTLYKPTSERDNGSFASTDKSRSAHLLRHLGIKGASDLTRLDVEAYRTARLKETTKRGGAPSPATLDRELALLQRVLNFAVSCGKLPKNHIAGVRPLNRSNVRRVVVAQDAFDRLHAAADEHLKPILFLAYTTGMRKSEILSLLWRGETDAYGLDLKGGVIRLADGDTKTDTPRTIFLTASAISALKAHPRHLKSPFVFVNPETGEPWKEVRRKWRAACKVAGLTGVWFHDLRRSFVTLARRKGIAQSVVRRFSGHRTDSVFARYNIIEEEDLRAAAVRLEAGTDLVPPPEAITTKTEAPTG